MRCFIHSFIQYIVKNKTNCLAVYYNVDLSDEIIKEKYEGAKDQGERRESDT